MKCQEVQTALSLLLFISNIRAELEKPVEKIQDHSVTLEQATIAARQLGNSKGEKIINVY
jgi:hypothetical protein